MAAEASANGVALISGAAGIAAATARLLAAAGCEVVVLDRDANSLKALQTELPRVITVEVDICDEGAAGTAVAAAIGRFGRLDVLVNAVGISGRRFGDGPVHECTDEGWDIVMETNAKSMFRMCRAALAPMLAARRGSIVNVASVLGYAPSNHFATHAYAASKGAIIALTRAMAAHYAAANVRVNAVAPGLIATAMSARAQGDPATREYIRTRQPLSGDFGNPEDVAEAIQYLALNRSSFVTGVVLEVAGGWSIAG